MTTKFKKGEYHGKINLWQEADGSFALLNSADGTLVGYPTAVTTQNRSYYLTDWDRKKETHLDGAQIYRGHNGLHAYGRIAFQDGMDLVSSPIRSISVAGPKGESFEIQADEIRATTDLRLQATNGLVSIQGDYAATIFGDQAAIDAEAERLLLVRSRGINAPYDSFRMRDLPVLNAGAANAGMP